MTKQHPDPAVILGQAIRGVTDEMVELDTEHHRRGYEHADPEITQAYTVLFDRKNALEDLIAVAKATTIEGALAQVMAASGIAADLEGLTGWTSEEVEEGGSKIALLLGSAAVVLKELSGLSADELPGEWYKGCNDNNDNVVPLV